MYIVSSGGDITRDILIFLKSKFIYGLNLFSEFLGILKISQSFMQCPRTKKTDQQVLYTVLKR